MARAGPTTAARIAGLRVLVAEDESLIVMLVEEMLEELGCTMVGPAGSLSAALDVVERAEIDCAILDVNLSCDPERVRAAGCSATPSVIS